MLPQRNELNKHIFSHSSGGLFSAVLISKDVNETEIIVLIDSNGRFFHLPYLEFMGNDENPSQYTAILDIQSLQELSSAMSLIRGSTLFTTSFE